MLSNKSGKVLLKFKQQAKKKHLIWQQKDAKVKFFKKCYLTMN